MIDRYVELHAASAFSFLEGASQPERLIERAVELEMPAMALLDRNGFYGSARFYTSAKWNDVRAHVGAEISVSSLVRVSLRRRGCRTNTSPPVRHTKPDAYRSRSSKLAAPSCFVNSRILNCVMS